MDRLTPRFGRLLGAAALMCLPTAAALLTLTALGAISLGVVVVTLGVVWLATAVLLRSSLRELLTVARHIRALGERDDDPPPPLPISRLDIGQTLLSAAAHLDRVWRRRVRALRAQIGSDARVVNSLPDPLLMLGEDAIIVRANRAAHQLFDRDPTGQELTTLLRDPGVLDAIESVLGATPSRQVTWIMPGSLRREFEVRATRLPARGVDGGVVLVTFHDITALRRLEQMRADFVANASHELRTPLSSLIGFTETLATSARDDAEARDRFLAIMLEQAHRMQRLIEDLLSLSRIEMEEHTPPRDAQDLVPILDGVLRLMDLKGRDKGMTFVRDWPTDPPPPPVIGDADQLAQVFQNLVENAIKYGRRDTPVTLSVMVVDRGPAAMPAALRAPCLRVTVRDRGEGIPKEHIPRLTERFYRVDRARSRAMGGTGLGLAIVKHVLSRHRGAMTLDSTVGEGTQVHVFLPLADRVDSSRPGTATASASAVPADAGAASGAVGRVVAFPGPTAA